MNQCGQLQASKLTLTLTLGVARALLVSDLYLRLTLSYFSTIIYSLHLIVKPLPNCQLVNVIMLNSDYHSLGLIFNKAERLIRCV